MENMEVLVNQQNGTIEFQNYEEIKTELAEAMEEYRVAEFSEKSKGIAKSVVADLRKLKKDVDARRIQIKKTYMDPYMQFEEKTKELIKLIDEPIEFIDSQIKAFEAKQKQEKREKIAQFYQDSIGDMEEYLPLDKIYDSKWENVSTTMKSVQETITQAIDSTRQAVDTIQGMNSDAVPDALKCFKQDLSLTNAIARVNNYEAEKAKILERQKAEEAAKEERRLQAEIERAKAAEREAIEREQEAARKAVEQAIPPKQDEEIQTPFVQEDNADEELPFVQPSTVTAFYKVVATPEELENVEMAFNSIGIYFERRDS